MMHDVLNILLIAGVGSCVFIALQDFRSREVHILPLILFTIAGAAFHFISEGKSGMIGSLFSLSIVLMVTGTAWVWFKLRRGGKFFDVGLGWGDVWILAALALWLNPAEFLLLYISATCGLLFLLAGMKLAGKMSSPEIPLAGGIAVVSMIFLPVYYFYFQ